MASAFTMAYGGIQGSKCLHQKLLNTTLRLSLLSFVHTPLGRILNRFSDDMATVDFVLPFTIRSMINCVLHVATTVVVVGGVTPVCLTTVPSMALLYYLVQVCMLHTCCFVVETCVKQTTLPLFRNQKPQSSEALFSAS